MHTQNFEVLGLKCASYKINLFQPIAILLCPAFWYAMWQFLIITVYMLKVCNAVQGYLFYFQKYMYPCKLQTRIDLASLFTKTYRKPQLCIMSSRKKFGLNIFLIKFLNIINFANHLYHNSCTRKVVHLLKSVIYGNFFTSFKDFYLDIWKYK